MLPTYRHLVSGSPALQRRTGTVVDDVSPPCRVPDEKRSSNLEPLLIALGVPWVARRVLAGLRVVTKFSHEPGVALVESTSSRLGAPPPTRLLLDGFDLPIPKAAMSFRHKAGSIRASELLGAVQIETTLPDGRGRIRDTRRVLPTGSELEYTFEGEALC